MPTRGTIPTKACSCYSRVRREILLLLLQMSRRTIWHPYQMTVWPRGTTERRRAREGSTSDPPPPPVPKRDRCRTPLSGKRYQAEGQNGKRRSCKGSEAVLNISSDEVHGKVELAGLTLAAQRVCDSTVRQRLQASGHPYQRLLRADGMSAVGEAGLHGELRSSHVRLLVRGTD